jgi:FkbM family methyltransferase
MTRMLKAARASQPFNAIATSLVRGAFRWRDHAPEGVIRHLHRVGHVRERLPNGRCLHLWSRGDDWVSNQVFWRGWAGYEPETVPLFFHLAQQARVTLDIGAYVGYFTLLAAHANPQGRVLAFEPLPGPRERLIRHVGLNRLENVDCFAMAAGAEDGIAELLHAPLELPTSSSLSATFMRGVEGLQALKVQVRALAGLLAERGISGVDLVKIDTETTEPDVLDGLQGVLERDRPAIFCEVLAERSDERRLTETLSPLGYRFFLLTGSGPVPRSSLQGDPRWLNFLFLPPGRELPQMSRGTTVQPEAIPQAPR